MTTEPKLLTEAEARGAWAETYKEHGKSITDYFTELRERGMIVEEPVDPLLVEARELCAKECGGVIYPAGQEAPDALFRRGFYDNGGRVRIALAALRRGMELAPRKELTREMVRKIYNDTKLFSPTDEAHITRLHAALTEALQ